MKTNTIPKVVACMYGDENWGTLPRCFPTTCRGTADCSGCMPGQIVDDGDH